MFGPLTVQERIDHAGFVLATVTARAAGVKRPDVHKLFDWPRIMGEAAVPATPAGGFDALWEMAKRNGERVSQDA